MKTPTAKRARPKPRILDFARFFKGYMGAATIINASLPIPATQLNLIPTYQAQKGFLTVYTSLFCFLLVAFLFSIRHRLARLMFSNGRMSILISVLPLVLIILTVSAILGYHALLNESVQSLRDHGILESTKDILLKEDDADILHPLSLALSYILIFLFAEGAFVLMALREYLQDVLKLNEISLLQGMDPFSVESSEAAPGSSIASTLSGSST